MRLLYLLLFFQSAVACLMIKATFLGYEWNETSFFCGTGLDWIGIARYTYDTLAQLDGRHRDGVWVMAICEERFVALPLEAILCLMERMLFVCELTRLPLWIDPSNCVTRSLCT
jgi:hypothetical protein